MRHGERRYTTAGSAIIIANSLQLAKAAATVESHGAREVWAIVTHGILSGKAIDTINASCLSGVVVTNSKCCTPDVLLMPLLTILIAVPRMSKLPRNPGSITHIRANNT